MRQLRADRIGSHRTQFEKNKKRILATQDICGKGNKPSIYTTLQRLHILNLYVT